MSGLQKYIEQWEHNAATDPLWAILTDASKSERRWNADEFFATGEVEVSSIFALVDQRLGGVARDTFLDFGCGVGRISRALGRHFARGTGVDISARMIELARDFHRSERSQVEFEQNGSPDLLGFPSRSVSFVYSHMVLQHIPAVHQIAYIREMLRILATGGIAAFQTAEATLVDPRTALRHNTPASIRHAVNRALRRTRVHRSAYEMHVVRPSRVLAAAANQGCQVVFEGYTNSTELGHQGAVHFFDACTARRRILTAESNSSYLGHFYFVRRV